jgi:hypothetical protein
MKAVGAAISGRPYGFVPLRLCAPTALCPYGFVPLRLCAPTAMCPYGYVLAESNAGTESQILLPTVFTQWPLSDLTVQCLTLQRLDRLKISTQPFPLQSIS